MCGIAGFFGQRPISPEARQSMLAALASRGPDARHENAWADGLTVSPTQSATSALLHARLAIRDPRAIADQPMFSEDGQVALCYNGEVYGWESDAEALRSKGHVFHTHSDTEFILNAYLEWGFPALLQHLRGMFALTILDRRTQKVFLARDRMGLKPLIYGQRADGFAFGSTVRAVLPWLPEDEREFNPEAIDAYLAHRYIPAPRTIFTNLQRLENAHYLIYDLQTGKLEKARYWSMPQASGDTAACSQAEVLSELREAVAMRTVADRPVGIFLSGGIDSSAIASILAETGHQDLASFTATFSDKRFDESLEAAQIAATLGLVNHAIAIPGSIADIFDKIVADLDEPFADPSSIPTWLLARETVKHVTVVLGGDGGDEIFAGYKRHPKHLRTLWRRHLRLPFPATESATGKGWRRLADELSLPWEEAYTLRFSGFSPAQRRHLGGGKQLRKSVWWRAADTHPDAPIEQLLACDFANTLPEYILRKADLCSMAHGLEMRAPLLDHRWLEKLARVAPEERFTTPAKHLLEPAMRRLQALALFEQKKKGFNPPLTEWLHGDLHSRINGMGQRLQRLSNGLLRAEAIDALADNYFSGSHFLAEQMLQLTILDTSLQQLDALRKRQA